MSYKRISLRFNMEDADERRAWELLHNSALGGYAYRRAVRVGTLIRDDPERLWTVFQNVYVHGNRTGSAFHLCR